ncbi:UDP-N-acetylmuramate--L-alanine ligase [Cyanobacterium sp. uoEpiScrs1]|uniref:UDP-N-acetylmuramate--L-alanine ligase n=1 Tax=Cyanobacterium sp. uoEpiScrs1 TaxID=2976343 RepID=UPI003A5CDBEB
MSALAYVLAKRQIPVSGSDLRSSHITKKLQEVGTHIFSCQEATNLEFFHSGNEQVTELVPPSVNNSTIPLINQNEHDRELRTKRTLTKQLPQVIFSTAIAKDNSEYQAAQKKGCPIFHRSDVLAALIKDYKSIAVAGTHGKTTTSSLLGYVLLKAGLDPTIIIGGEVDAWNGNAHFGYGEYLVAEADESDGSLVKHFPSIGIVTNIELDHPDHYKSLEDVIKTFQTFEIQCETLIGCIDCETVRTQLNPTITYSLDPHQKADYIVKEITYSVKNTTFEVWERGQFLGQVCLSIPGKHNVSNALAALAVGRKLGLEFERIAEALATFSGTKRRFEYRGQTHGITFIDDYAHHPSEIRATLSAARSKVEQNSRLVAIFQPHRYSRTATFLEEFTTAFQDADFIVLTDIYSAGEANIANITGQDLANEVKRHHSEVIYQPSLEALIESLPKLLRTGDLVLFLGAGNLNQIIPRVIAAF